MNIKRTVLLVLAVVCALGWFASLSAAAAATLDITTRDPDNTCAKSVPHCFTLVTFSLDHKGWNPLNVGPDGSTIITGTGPDVSANLIGGYLIDRDNRVGSFGRDSQLLFTELEGFDTLWTYCREDDTLRHSGQLVFYECATGDGLEMKIHKTRSHDRCTPVHLGLKALFPITRDVSEVQDYSTSKTMVATDHTVTVTNAIPSTVFLTYVDLRSTTAWLTTTETLTVTENVAKHIHEHHTPVVDSKCTSTATVATSASSSSSTTLPVHTRYSQTFSAELRPWWLLHWLSMPTVFLILFVSLHNYTGTWMHQWTHFVVRAAVTTRRVFFAWHFIAWTFLALYLTSALLPLTPSRPAAAIFGLSIGLWTCSLIVTGPCLVLGMPGRTDDQVPAIQPEHRARWTGYVQVMLTMVGVIAAFDIYSSK